MTANEWLGVMKQASDFPQGMEKLILKYGEMLIAEHESKVKKLTIPDVSNSLIAYQKWCYQHPEYDQVCETGKVEIYMKGNL
jgi:hypothetical protein